MRETYLQSKPRYEILDGLRGVAAILVVCYHLLESHFHLATTQPLNHGHLAVDFFFLLSGFVIGYAYDDRWQKMSLWAFAKRRLIRLHPMVMFGTLFGALMFYFGACGDFPMIESTPWWAVVGIMLFGFTMLPCSTSMDIRGWGETNPLDGPAWSLQWEYLANALYALVIRRMGNKMLGICVFLFGLLTVNLCLNIDVFGVWAERTDLSYTVVGGWNLEPSELLVGATRLLYPFFCGLLLSRVKWVIRVSGGFWWCSAGVILLLAMPWMGLGAEGAARWTNGLYEAAAILVGFPLIVAMGAGSSQMGGRAAKISDLLGHLSFPLYITHYHFIYLQMGWTADHPDAPVSTHVMVAASCLIMALMTAWAALKLYDLPVRAWLKKKLF